jgi:hypothetical protein
MNQRESLSKPKIAIAAAFIYTAIMGCGMFYMKAFRGITYGEPEMMTVFWIVLLGLNLLNVFWVTRYFDWRAIGFRSLDRKQLLWFLPSIVVLIVQAADPGGGSNDRANRRREPHKALSFF